MDARAAAIADEAASECVWLLEHPPLYTAGTSASDDELLEPGRFPVFKTGRGGRYTYHGPGQRIAYVMVDLTPRGRDVRAYVAGLGILADRHAGAARSSKASGGPARSASSWTARRSRPSACACAAG